MGESANDCNIAGRVPSRGAGITQTDAASGDAAYKAPGASPVGRVPSHGVPLSSPDDPPPRRLRRLHRVWPDRDAIFLISSLFAWMAASVSWITKSRFKGSSRFCWIARPVIAGLAAVLSLCPTTSMSLRTWVMMRFASANGLRRLRR